MRTRANRKYVASDRARRESFASETLCSLIGKTASGALLDKKMPA